MGRARCVLLFSRDPREEGSVKGVPNARLLFAYARRRIEAAVAALDGIDLVCPPQRGRTFSERLLNAFQDLRARGYLQIVAVPTDVPALERRQILAAFESLGQHDVVLGPSPDGGVYLIGTSAEVDHESFFRAVRWRTGRAASDLLAGAAHPVVLQDWIADIDGRADLMVLRHDAHLEPELARLIRWLFTPLPASCAEERRPPKSLCLTSPIDPRGPPGRSLYL